jgi:hypothetical protein
VGRALGAQPETATATETVTETETETVTVTVTETVTATVTATAGAGGRRRGPEALPRKPPEHGAQSVAEDERGRDVGVVEEAEAHGGAQRGLDLAGAAVG